MTDESTQFSIAELGEKFGAQLSETYAKIIILEKQLLAEQAQIQEMTKTEARLVENAEDLEAELARLKSEIVELERKLNGQMVLQSKEPS